MSNVRDAIVATFAHAGLECCNSATLEISKNVAFADVSPETIRALVERSDAPDAQAIAIICTSLPAAWLVEQLADVCQKPVFDFTLVTIWHTLRLAGRHDTIQGWGRLFTQET